ncbi:hypothetical protein F2Q69_00007365 [Brassica cretica]|uniref:Uncharacterized protein n=1 Tax=Brassica cretica TaxID=69181 RepID=A0A8S9P5T6_BRACR|nr:hypothetical protein F2Q69_00007365 [Brassica cretica]
MKKNQLRTYQKTQIYYERETWEKTPSEDFLEFVWKTSKSRSLPGLPGSRLEVFWPRSLPDLKNLHLQKVQMA